MGLTTDINGEITYTGLAPGKYYFQETKSPDGYVLDTTKLEFEIIFNQTQTLTVNKTNTLIPGGVKLVKKDATTNGLLQGAEFSLYKEDDTLVASGLTSDINGEITYTGLAPGKYYFQEKKSPTGYVLDTTKLEFEIVFNQTQILTINKTNTQKPGDVKLVKTDDITNELLSDAEFSLYKEDNTLVASGLTTDSNGEITYTELAPGKYYFQETKAPIGYVLDDTKLEFEIVFNQIQIVTVSKTNHLKPGDVKLVKIDAVTNKELQGAKFSLYKEDGTLIEKDLVTDVSGEITYTGLLPGKYYFQETQAPNGYELNTEVLTFQIVKNQTTTLTITFKNTPIPEEPNDKVAVFNPKTNKTPTTVDMSNPIYYGYLLALSGLILALLKKRFIKS
ncbi:MAG: collagen binding domain-containing protein [Coprobacillaceae bacterium]